MKKIINKYGKNISIISILIFIAVICRMIPKFEINIGGFGILLNMTRSMIYMGLYIVWGFSIQHRIVAKHVRRQLLEVALLLIFWVLVRTIKYYFVVTPGVIRNLWYMYYIPMLFVPMLAVFISMSLGKKEDYHVPGWMHIFTAITTILVLLVLTNDFHHLIFTFPEGALIQTDANHGYAPLYFGVLGWEIFCGITAVLLMLSKCRIPNTKKVLLLPFLPVTIAIVYGCLYVSGMEWLRIVAGDITIFQCLTFAACFESCIQCGLIRSNSYNKDIFDASDFPIIITDSQYNIYMAADLEIPAKDIMKKTEKASVINESGIRISGNKIRGGYALWMEDLTEILEIIKNLQDLNDSLKESHLTKQEEYRTEKKKAQLIEANRLYNQMQIETAEQVKKMQKLLQQIREINDKNKEREYLMQLMLLGTYFKRRNNLLFIAETQERIKVSELEYCLKESFSTLELMGVKCKYHIQINKEISHFDVIEIYDAIEQILERTLGNLSALAVIVQSKNEEYILLINLKLRKVEEIEFDHMYEVEQEEEDEYMLTCHILSRKEIE